MSTVDSNSSTAAAGTHVHGTGSTKRPAAAGEFFEKVEATKTELQVGHTYLQQLTTLINGLGSSRGSSANYKQRLDVMARIQGLLHELEVMGKQRGLSKRVKESRSAQEKRLAKDFNEFKAEFGRVSQLAKQKHSEAEAKKEQMGSDTFHAAAAAAASQDEEVSERQSLLDNAPVQTLEYIGIENELTFNHAVIHERHDLVTQMEQDMHDVQDMFEDLAVMVVDQGKYIDDIENNITVTKHNAEASLKELSQASDYQKRKRNKMCCLACLFVSAGVGLILFLSALVR